jgi:L-rhamnose mutarotase
MERFCFLLKVKQDLLNEYLTAHGKVWPEMLEAMHNAGIRNYSMFYREDGLLIGYLEADNVKEALRKSAETDASRRWQKVMARFFEPVAPGKTPGEYQEFREYFYTD